MNRIPAWALSLVLVAAGLSGCASFEDLGDGDLDDALALVPGEAASLVFFDREAMAERLGIDDIEHGASKEDTSRYTQTVLEKGGVTSTTPFVVYLDRMAKDAAFSELDIVWEATASARGDSQDALPRIYKMSEDLDLDDVGDDLVDAGYAEDEIGGHRHLHIAADATEFDGMVGAYPGIEMLDVVIVPDEHLMLVGSSVDAVRAAVDVFEDDADSATDAGAFDDVIDGVEDPEYALLIEGPGAGCAGPSELGTPEATGFFLSGDGPDTTSVLAFADDDAAEADLEGRKAYLDDGVLQRTQQPIADIAEWKIERDGNVVRIDYTYDNPGFAVDAAYVSDGFHACNPG